MTQDEMNEMFGFDDAPPRSKSLAIPPGSALYAARNFDWSNLNAPFWSSLTPTRFGLPVLALLGVGAVWWLVHRRPHAPVHVVDGVAPVAAVATETVGVELDERLVSLQRGTHQPGELLAAATATGYHSLGWPDGGRIAVGALADLTSVELTSPRLAGIEPDHAAAAVVFAATAGDVHHVIVGGRVVVADGMHRTIDVSAELDSSIKQTWS